MNCIKCDDEIIGRQSNAKYCSERCKKLYLKSQYRKRTREARYEYAHMWRAAKNGGNRPPKYAKLLRDTQCLNCGSTKDLQLAHIKPLFAGGTHKYTITLCRKHHYQFDTLLRDFWKQGMSVKGS